RHTRWPRDWSSDVCSSDLIPELPRPGARARQDPRRVRMIGVALALALTASDKVDVRPGADLALAGAALLGTAIPELFKTDIAPEIGRASCRERREVDVVEV